MKKSCWIRTGVIILAAVLMAGCISPKKMEIFRGMEYDVRYEATPPEDLQLQPFDRLKIQVISEIPQLAAPFNAAVNYDESSKSTQNAVSYVVDREGCIEFPKLGPVNVMGLTTRELENLLSIEIKEKGYIKDPTVKVDLENFEITVIGDRNQQINVNGGINLVQLIARTGGPSYRFKMDDVMVIRTENGYRQAYKVDIRKKDIFESPVFYLQQNDIVYLKNKVPVQDPTIQTVTASISSILAGVSVITSVLILTRLSK